MLIYTLQCVVLKNEIMSIRICVVQLSFSVNGGGRMLSENIYRTFGTDASDPHHCIRNGSLSSTKNPPNQKKKKKKNHESGCEGKGDGGGPGEDGSEGILCSCSCSCLSLSFPSSSSASARVRFPRENRWYGAQIAQ